MAFAPTQTVKTLKEQVKCPICLEVYKTPRSLSCLHTFCEKCLDSHILKAVEKGFLKPIIQCPLCRKETASPIPSKSPTEWARELPMNYALVPALETMERGRRRRCDSCAAEEKSNAAKSYCSDCNQYQCAECVSSHKKFPFMKNHKIVAIQSAVTVQQQLNLGRAEYCSMHPNKKVKFCCGYHDVVCCSTCAIADHRSCEELTEVKKLGQGVKDGDRPKKLETEMKKLQIELGEIKETLEDNVTDIEKQAAAIPLKMSVLRNKLVNMIDQLVSTVSSDCGQIKKQRIAEVQVKIDRIRSLEAAVNGSRTLLQALMKLGSEAQVFLAVSRLEEQVNQYQKQVRDALKTTSTVNLQLCIGDVLETLVQSSSPLAKVTAEQRKLLPNVLLARCEVQKLPLIAIRKRSQLNQPGYIGAGYLADGRLVAADGKNSLCCLLDDAMNVIADARLPSKPIDLTVIGPTDFVVVLLNNKYLQLISVLGTTLKLIRPIPCNRIPRSVSRVSDTELAVGWDTGIGIISLDGEEMSYIKKDKSGKEITFTSELDRIVADVNSSRVYRSSWNTNTVQCLGFAGETHFTYENGLSYPSGLSLDRDGNIYICSHGSSRVHQISPEGKEIRIIYVGFSGPFTVCFNPAGDQMTVMNYSPTTIMLKADFKLPQNK